MKTRCVYLLFIVVLIIASHNYLIAQNNITTNTQNLFQYNTPDTEDKGPSYFSLVVKTLFILGLFGLGVYVIFKYISQKQGLMAPNLNMIKLITSLPVGTNRFIQIIEIGNNYFLIGVSENNINLIKEITDKETMNLIQVMKSQKSPAHEKIIFTEFLKNILSGLTKKIPKGDNLKFLRKQKDRLHNLSHE